MQPKAASDALTGFRAHYPLQPFQFFIFQPTRHQQLHTSSLWIPHLTLLQHQTSPLEVIIFSCGMTSSLECFIVQPDRHQQ